MKEDAEAEFEFELRYAACSGAHCDSVARIGDACYTGLAGGAPTGTYDCSLSDAEILALEAGEPA